MQLVLVWAAFSSSPPMKGPRLASGDIASLGLSGNISVPSPIHQAPSPTAILNSVATSLITRSSHPSWTSGKPPSGRAPTIWPMFTGTARDPPPPRGQRLTFCSIKPSTSDNTDMCLSMTLSRVQPMLWLMTAPAFGTCLTLPCLLILIPLTHSPCHGRYARSQPACIPSYTCHCSGKYLQWCHHQNCTHQGFPLESMADLLCRLQYRPLP